MPDIRTRFAPSPTGYLHIGGARTALFNFLYARHCGGTFVLRIEDTDRERSTTESREAVLDSLTWLGLDWDEGPFLQSERTDRHRERAGELIERGLAYRCRCTAEVLDTKRKAAIAAGRKAMYDGTCRTLDIPADSGEPLVVRFRSPSMGETIVDDLVKGAVIFQNVELDDLIIIRSDGTPTYNFCVVVDDGDMRITHILRGDDHLSNTPRQILIYEALQLPIPRFAHVPLILGTDRARLSKRHGAVSVTSYRDEGYLPEAMVNYLARLGWSLGDQEIFSMPELIESFTVENVGKAAGIFNPEKLLWLNTHYIKERSPKQIAQEALPFVRKAGLAPPTDLEWFARILVLLQPRARTLVEMAQMTAYFLTDEVPLEPTAAEKFLKPAIVPALADLVAGLDGASAWTEDSIHQVFDTVLAARELGLGKLAQPTRLAVTGGTNSPGIFEVIELLGRERTLRRLRAAIARASTPAGPATPA
jgi:glutamyl-tRNA synthetase